jgi:hypothetical protein
MLRPTSREITSAYKVNTAGIAPGDLLRLTIRDEATPDAVLGLFEFRGRDVFDRQSVHFSAERLGKAWKITFSGAKPFATTI